jgi:hypothetical protein
LVRHDFRNDEKEKLDVGLAIAASLVRCEHRRPSITAAAFRRIPHSGGQGRDPRSPTA